MRRVLIVEDILEARQWLSDLVMDAFPQASLRTATTLRSAMERIEDPFDLAMIDLGLPDGSGLTVVRRLREVSPSTICVVTTVLGDDATIVAALSAGAHGYILKETNYDVLRRQLLQLSTGMPVLSPAIARRIMEHFRHTGPSAVPEGQLTQREIQVLGLIGRGLRNAEVGTELGIAATTVAGYIKTIYRKLGIGSRAEAAWHATRMGLSTRSD